MTNRLSLLVGTLLALATLSRGGGNADTLRKDNAKMKVTTRVPLQAVPFDLKEVRLLDGPFQHAQELDRRYLLSLDPERLLHNYRVNAGLHDSAKPLGGWEAPDCELRGHFVGHYLSACARMFAATGDETLKRNAEYVVTELAKCQKALGSGYLSAYPETFLDRVEARERVWAPWYTLHKIYAGMLDVYLYCDDKQALTVAEKMADWAKRRTDQLSDDKMQKMLDTEHGGMNETLANLYALTGEEKYLALAERFNHQRILVPLAHHEDPLNGLHANTQIPKVIGVAREYELTGDARYRTMAEYFWDVVTKERSYVIGGNSDGEMFSPKENLSHALGPDTTETCNTYNMLKLTQHLFMWTTKAEYADYYERALYNHILASQNPETGMMCYYVPLRTGSHKEYNTPDESFWCCTGTGVENHAQYGADIYFHDGGTGLYVNLFIASQLNWKEKGITLRQETRFPDEGATHLVFTCSKPQQLDLRIRHPFWANDGFRIVVNGKEEANTSAPGSYTVLSRTWKSGDTVNITLPMTLRTEAFRDDPHKIALLYGPLVLCAPINGSEEIPTDLIAPDTDRVLSEVTPIHETPLNFTLTGLFHAAGKEEKKEMRLTPFYQTYKSRYIVYWDVKKEDAK